MFLLNKNMGTTERRETSGKMSLHLLSLCSSHPRTALWIVTTEVRGGGARIQTYICPLPPTTSILLTTSVAVMGLMGVMSRINEYFRMRMKTLKRLHTFALKKFMKYEVKLFKRNMHF